jgi:hypothetical protein
MTQHQLEKILEAIDQANSLDPNREIEHGESQPKELLYGRRMSAWLARLRPDADAALQIAARAQHIRRWEHPREEYPMDRKGYLAWRRGLYTFHAEQIGAIMEAAGVDGSLIERVSFLLQKATPRRRRHPGTGRCGLPRVSRIPHRRIRGKNRTR